MRLAFVLNASQDKMFKKKCLHALGKTDAAELAAQALHVNPATGSWAVQKGWELVGPAYDCYPEVAWHCLKL